MAPRISPGDVVVTRPLALTDVAPGQVLLVDDPDHLGRLRLHRLVRVDTQGRLVLRGDANPAEDSSHISPTAVRGAGMLRIPSVGLPVLWLRTGQWGHLSALLLAAGIVLALATRDRADRRPPGSNRGRGPRRRTARLDPTRRARQSRHSPDPAGVVSARSARTLACAAATVAMAVAASALPMADASLAASTQNAADTWGAAPYYTCAAAVSDGVPYLWYRLDDTTASTAVDSSGNGRNGTYRGTGTTTRATRACVRDTGTAVTLSGSGYISTPTLIATPPNTFTLEAWLKATSTTGGTIIGFGTSQTGSLGTYDRQIYLTNAGKVVFGVAPITGKATITSTAAYNDGAWHHVAATLSSTGMNLYVDGNLTATDSSTTTGQALSGYWRIGYTNLAGWPAQPTNNMIAATLDDTAIYTTALSAATIKAHYTAGT